MPSTSTRQPLVSVILPAYNAVKYIEPAVDSILGQTYENFELLLLNDGSTDGTLEVLKRYAARDSRVKVIENERNLGLVATLNKGLALAKGDLIARQDADDISFANRFDEQVRFLQTHPRIGVVGSAMQVIDEHGDGTEIYQQPETDALIRFRLLFNNSFVHTSVMMRRDIIEKHQLRYNPQFLHVEDYEFWTQLAAVTEAYNFQDPLVMYRIASGSISQTYSTEQARRADEISAAQLKRLDSSFAFTAESKVAMLDIFSRYLWGRLGSFTDEEKRILPRLLKVADTAISRFPTPDGLLQLFAANIRGSVDPASSHSSNRAFGVLHSQLADAQAAKAWLSEQVENWKLEAQNLQAEANHWKAEAEQWKVKAEQERKQWVGSRAKSKFQKIGGALTLGLRTRQLRKTIRFHLDAPDEALTIGSSIPLDGWCFSTAKEIQGIRVKSVDEKKKKQIVYGAYGIPRPDFGGAFADEHLAAKNGFSIPLKLAPGRHVVRLETCVDGEWIPLLRTVVSQPAPPQASPKERRVSSEQPAWPKDKPLVSIVISDWSSGAFLKEAIDSVIAQTWTDLEILVVDAGSRDPNTNRVLENLQHPKARVIRKPEVDVAALRNHAISEARGKYICSLRGDDNLAPTYLEKCLVRLEVERLDLCGSWQQDFGEANSIRKPGEFSTKDLFKWNSMTDAAVFRRDLCQQVGGFDEQLSSSYQHWELWLRMAVAGAQAATIPDALFFYRKQAATSKAASWEEHQRIHATLRSKNKQREHLETILEEPAAPGLVKPWRALSRGISAPNNGKNILLAMPFLMMGGAESIVNQICRHLVAEGYRITVITTVPASPEMGDTTPLFAEFAEVFHLPATLPRQQWPSFIFHLLQSRSINFLWQAGSAFLYELMPAIHREFDRIKGIDLVFNTVGHAANNRKYAHHFDKHCVENSEVQKWLIQEGEFPERIRLIPNGVDTKKFFPKAKADAIQRIASELAGKFVVGFFGRISEEKGPDVFVRIAERFANEEQFVFLLGGVGPVEAAVKKQAADAGLNNKIRFLGCVNIQDWLPCCDVVVVPSRFDGRPNIVLESFALGVPVIASKVGGLPEMVVGNAGFLCPSENVEAFVNQLALLNRCPDILQQMKTQARRTAEERFPINGMFDSYSQLLKELAQ